MKLLGNILGSLFTKIEYLIENMSVKTAMTIRSGFLFFAFVACTVGVIWGIKSGKEAAKIKSAPLFSSTNESFSLDIKREANEGTDATLLDSDSIWEKRQRDTEKLKFSTRENMEPIVDKGIIEPDRDKKSRGPAGMKMSGDHLDYPIADLEAKADDVKPIKKRRGLAVDENESSVISDIKSSSGENERTNTSSETRLKNDRADKTLPHEMPGINEEKRGRDGKIDIRRRSPAEAAPIKKKRGLAD